MHEDPNKVVELRPEANRLVREWLMEEAAAKRNADQALPDAPPACLPVWVEPMQPAVMPRRTVSIWWLTFVLGIGWLMLWLALMILGMAAGN